MASQVVVSSTGHSPSTQARRAAPAWWMRARASSTRTTEREQSVNKCWSREPKIAWGRATG
eukprot:6178294-Pleurochrysis_carterae.AAC.3